MYFSVWFLLCVYLTEHLPSSDAQLHPEQRRQERAGIHTADQTSKTYRQTDRAMSRKIYLNFIDILMTLRFSHSATLLAGL